MFLDIEFKENYYALIVCIVKKTSIERSLQMIINGQQFETQRDMSITDKDIEDMIRRKSAGETHQSIGEIYGLSEEATYRRIKRYKERQAKKHGKTKLDDTLYLKSSLSTLQET